jgi:hypothetical protein
MNPSSIHIKRFLLFYLTFFLFEGAFSQVKTNVLFKNSDRSSIQVEMERSISGLLTELNNAFANNKDPKLQNIKISAGCALRIKELWNNASISSPEKSINATLLLTPESSTFGKGYQVRNIPLSLKGKDGTFGKEMGVITFNSAGEIVAFYFAAAELDMSLLDWDANTLIEAERLEKIKYTVENFKLAYNRKDVQTIDDFFSDYALIITGQVVKRAPSDFNRLADEEVKYTVKDKQQYLKDIKALFGKNEFIDVKFRDFIISRHGDYPWIYGVNLIQTWNSPSYKDEGCLFLMIDFKDESNPIIHVRAWQKFDKNIKCLELGNFRIR